jgi:hypothetical protein
MPNLDEQWVMETLRDGSETLLMIMLDLNHEPHFPYRVTRGAFTLEEVVVALRRLNQAGYVNATDEHGLPLADRDWAIEPDLDTVWFELTNRGKHANRPSRT